MTAQSKKTVQKRLHNCVFARPKWVQIAGNLRENACEDREAPTTADAANAGLENNGKIRQHHTKTKILGKYRFIRIRLGSINSFASQAKKRKSQNANFFASVERAYGVPAGVLLAIHGMETGFGRFMGDVPVVSSITTVAYDCRRSAFFTPHALAALIMVDRGMLSANQRGAAHGELGHMQFLPGNALRYGVDGNGDGRVDLYNQYDALASAANFLRQKGWRPGQGYQEGQPNFRVLNEWNAATVYQQAIALAGKAIDS